jgi:hypothetical protein
MRRLILTSMYSRRAAKLLEAEEQDEMEQHIAADPERHPVIPGTGGVRKARWARPGKGKSGGVRVIYYFAVPPDAVYFLDLYAKNEKEDLSDADKKDHRKTVEALNAEYNKEN